MHIQETLRGRYQIVKELGKNRLGDTYLAQDIALPGHPYCVVKNLKPQQPTFFRVLLPRFNKEAEILYRLGNHDQIPRLFAHFPEEGEFYLIYEFVPGHDLSQEIVAGEPWSEGETKKLLEEILTVLAYVHDNKVIHRDIKPSNIIRCQEDGKLALIDFGAVKEINVLTINHRGQTNLTMSVGSPGYIPPEQIQGFASDIYGVGIIGIQALTGLEVSQLEEDPDTGEILWFHGVSVSEHLENVLTKMVRKDVSERYQNAGEALTALNTETGTTSTRIISATPQLNPISSQQPSISLVQTLTGHTDLVKSVAISPDGSTIVSGSADKTVKIWDLATGREKITLQGHTDWVYSVVITPDGLTIVSASSDNTIKVWDLDTGGEKETLPGHTDWVNSVAISPDRRTIVSGSWKNIKVLDVDTGEEKRTLKGHTKSVNSVVISPDGRNIVSGSYDNTIKVWDLDTGVEKRTLESHTSSVNSVAISPSGLTIVSGSDDTTVKVWDLATGKEKITLEGHTSSVWSSAISPDGSTIASGSRDNTIKVWQVIE